MTIRDQNLETIAPVMASFKIHQTTGVDDLKDQHIGQPVMLTGNNEIGPITAGGNVARGTVIAVNGATDCTLNLN
jgi:hypothetical protein